MTRIKRHHSGGTVTVRAAAGVTALLILGILTPIPAIAASSPAPLVALDGCDDACLATGAWSQTIPEFSQVAGIATGRVVDEQAGTWAIDAGGQSLAVTPSPGPTVWLPSEGLNLFGLDPSRPIKGTHPVKGIDRWWRPGQPVRVSGGAPGPTWTGDVELRLNWWEGPAAFTYQPASVSLDIDLGVLAGTVLAADNEGVTVEVGGHRVWLAAYPDALVTQLLDRVTHDVVDGIASVTDGRPYNHSLLRRGDPVLVWFDRDPWASTNPRGTPSVDPETSCPLQAGVAGCRWTATRIYLRPRSLPDAPSRWWNDGSYAWSNVNPSIGGDVLDRCSFSSEAVGTVVAVDPGRSVQVLAGGILVAMDQPSAAPVPLVGEYVRLRGGGCIANGAIERAGSVDIAPRPPGGLAGVTPSTHRLELTVDPAIAAVSERRTFDGVIGTYLAAVTRVKVGATLDGVATAPAAGTIQLVISEAGWLEAAAPGTLTVSDAERRPLGAGAPIDPWSVRILSRPPAGETKKLTITAYFVEKADGAFATATATVELVGGTYPQPTAAQAASNALLAGAGSYGVPDGIMVAKGGGAIEITVRPDGLASGGGVFNYKSFSCELGDLCSQGLLEADLGKGHLPDIISVALEDADKVAVSVSVDQGALTWLYQHPAVLAGERWAGVGLSLSGFLYDALGLDEICGSGSMPKNGAPQTTTRGVLNLLKQLGLGVSCELPDFGLQYITLASDDPLASSTGAFGLGSFFDLSLGLSLAPGDASPGSAGSQGDQTDLPGVGGLSLSFVDALSAVRLDQCGAGPSEDALPKSPVLVIPGGEQPLATTPTDPCVAQLSPASIARILARMALDPLNRTVFFTSPRQVLTWLVSADPNNAAVYVAALESYAPWANSVAP